MAHALPQVVVTRRGRSRPPSPPHPNRDAWIGDPGGRVTAQRFYIARTGLFAPSRSASSPLTFQLRSHIVLPLFTTAESHEPLPTAHSPNSARPIHRGRPHTKGERSCQ